MSTPAPGPARVRREVPALLGGLAVLAAGALGAVVGLPLLAAEQGCRSDRDAALDDVLAAREELTLHPDGTALTYPEPSTGCGEDGVASVAVEYEGTDAAAAVAFYEAELGSRGWVRRADVGPAVPRPAACWTPEVGGTAAYLTLTDAPPLGDRDVNPGYVLLVAAAHDADAGC